MGLAPCRRLAPPADARRTQRRRLALPLLFWPWGSVACAVMPPHGAVRAALYRAQALEEGRAGMRIHAFVDPYCPVCARLHRALRAALAAGRMKVRWIPVALLGEASLAAAAALLAGGSPLQLAQAYGGAAPPPMIAERWRLAVLANSALLRWIAGAAPVTPSLVREATDGTLTFAAGLPPAWTRLAG